MNFDQDAEMNREYLEEAAQRDLMDLMFLPGLSTAEEVTEVSGRGLGMDVVKSSLTKISGTVEVLSEPGIGTRFAIKLPLTLAIISALMVNISGEQYAIPLSYVVESIKVDPVEIHEVNHREIIKVRERIVPLIRISDHFGLADFPDGNRINVVIVQSTVGRMGIIVDSLVERQEIVIKALDDYVGISTGVAGATILGDGRVVMIIDVPTLLEQLSNRPGGAESLEVNHA